MLLKLTLLSIVLYMSQSVANAGECHGYHHTGQSWHKFHTDAKKWHEAKQVCLNEGGHLAVLNSHDEEKAVLELYNQGKNWIKYAARGDLAWLGGHNMMKHGEWVSVLGDPLHKGYCNWSKGCDGYPAEPNNSGGNEHCLSLYTTRCQGWNDYQCDYPLAFVCEKYNC